MTWTGEHHICDECQRVIPLEEEDDRVTEGDYDFCDEECKEDWDGADWKAWI